MTIVRRCPVSGLFVPSNSQRRRGDHNADTNLVGLELVCHGLDFGSLEQADAHFAPH
jgi:hypothetical protein